MRTVTVANTTENKRHADFLNLQHKERNSALLVVYVEDNAFPYLRGNTRQLKKALGFLYLKPVKLKGIYKTRAQAKKAIIECLKTYYSVTCDLKRNDWRLKRAIECIDSQLNATGVFEWKGAQWGGKWGNFYRLVALNSKGEYQYVGGFNPYKELY